jgi:hypothetical protein
MKHMATKQRNKLQKTAKTPTGDKPARKTERIYAFGANFTQDNTKRASKSAK